MTALTTEATIDEATTEHHTSLNPTLEQAIFGMFAERLFRRHSDDPEMMYDTMVALQKHGYLLDAPLAPLTVNGRPSDYATQPAPQPRHYIAAQAA